VSLPVFAPAASKRDGEKTIIKWKEEGNKRGTSVSATNYAEQVTPSLCFCALGNCSLLDDVIFNLAHRPEPFIINGINRRGFSPLVLVQKLVFPVAQ
jgi:hypothetical protein